MNIKVFGERNTGTNALISVIRGNSGSIVYPSVLAEISPDARKNLAMMMQLGISKKGSEQLIDATFKGRPILQQWKHAATYFDTSTITDDVHFVFTTRHPLSWLIGLFQKPYHILTPKPDNLIAFSEMNWETVIRDNLKSKTFKPLDLYVEKLKSYRDLMGKLEAQGIGYTIIKFEDFVSDQKGVFERLRPHLTNPTENFQELTKSTKEAGKDSAYYRNYYTKEIWRQEFPDIEKVQLPYESELFEFFGYA
ncbi:hypothetical protein [Thalassospira sp.]|uniref:hypothetical protein n=1 Tax=Thalassospira sp. TaxID=1912094 RepID=UPI001B0F0B1C|nr:hypothetical protein [Thalassospira sp.]MBO6806800.1 hypothetical protein [Thalassospira sp.]MBO6840422.1 hypothetical protein [Thalassospira sp.]